MTHISNIAVLATLALTASLSFAAPAQAQVLGSITVAHDGHGPGGIPTHSGIGFEVIEAVAIFPDRIPPGCGPNSDCVPDTGCNPLDHDIVPVPMSMSPTPTEDAIIAALLFACQTDNPEHPTHDCAYVTNQDNGQPQGRALECGAGGGIPH